MLFIAVPLYHVAIIKVRPHLADLPENLRDGFFVTFKFQLLEADSKDVKQQCETALSKCSVDASDCSNLANPSPLDRTSSTMTEKAKIVQAFGHSLSTVSRICNDKYFGTDSLAAVAADLDKMMQDVDQVDASASPCIATNVLYCSIHASASAVVASVGTVNAEIDKFIDSDMVGNYKDHANKLTFLHILPYVLVISALFFFIIWWKKTSKIGCCVYLIAHAVFWLLYFVINTIILALAILVKYAGDQIEIPFLKGKPNLTEFIEHIQTTYPEFWAVVFADMEEGLEFLFRSAAVFEVFCIVIVAYGCCLGCWRPYRDASAKVVDASEVTK